MDWNLKNILLVGAGVLTISVVQADGIQTNSEASNSPAPSATNHHPHYFVYGDALFLKAQEDGLDYAIVNKAPAISLSNPSGLSPQKNAEFKNAGSRWDWGFRIGLGYNFNRDSWYVGLSWTRFNTDNSRHVSVNLAKETLFPTRTCQTATGGSNFVIDFSQAAKAKWDLKYNTLDLDLGRYSFINRYFSLTPFVSIRAATIKQKLDIKYTNPYLLIAQGTRTFPKDQVDIKNEMWGIGPRLGLNTNWFFGCNLSMYANGSLALLWERFHIHMHETQTLPSGALFVPCNLKEGYHQVSFNAQLALGLQWDQKFSQDRYNLNIGLGWEQIFWLDQNQTFRFLSNVAAGSHQKEHGNFSLSGVRLGARLDF